MTMNNDCPLCTINNENIIFSNELFRVILVDDKLYPGFIRLILNQHYTEMTDLSQKDAHMVLEALLIIERQIRYILKPDKINLASLGNVVPHLHWHIIPRYTNDAHYPNPIWGNITNPQYQTPRELIREEQVLIKSIKNKLL